jgi:hypothetical protein
MLLLAEQSVVAPSLLVIRACLRQVDERWADVYEMVGEEAPGIA